MIEEINMIFQTIIV